MGTERQARIDEVFRRRQPDLTVVMENIHDPHNVSAMLRTCDAAGIPRVQLVYTQERLPDIGKKSSASAKKWVERRPFRSIGDCYTMLRSEGFAIYATGIEKNAESLYSVDMRRKIAIVFGNEHRGVSAEATKKADGVISIPMFGMIQSLNVSVACAVILFEAVRQRVGAGKYDGTGLADDEIRKVLERSRRVRKGWKKTESE
ncbi:MAG TPA: RNA methyltransferase [Bacteroidota bacterium]|nr:RNA methyltransferase [Bacteroidota bacterium]